MVRKRSRPALYFSFRSPYSFLALRKLRAVCPDVFTAFDVLPYWDPDDQTRRGLDEAGGEFHYVDMSRAKHRYILMDTKRLAQEAGIALAWPIDVKPHWEQPHLGWLRARALGRAEQFYDQVVAARWLRGADVCTPEVIAQCAEAAGLDAGEIVAAHHDPEVRAEGVGCLRRAFDDDVFAIPYLKWGNHRFWGLDRVDAFLKVWQADPPPPPVQPPPQPTHAYDTDHAGGCG